MSRTIEQERIDAGDLSEDEIIYLAQRDKLPAAAAEKAEVVLRARRLLASSPPQLNDLPNTGDVNTLRVTREDLLALGLEVLETEDNPPEQFDSAFAGQRPPGAPTPTEGTAQPLPEDDEEEEEDDRPYSEWSKRELAAEIHRRNQSKDEDGKIPLSGNHGDLAARLEADDEE